MSASGDGSSGLVRLCARFLRAGLLFGLLGVSVPVRAAGSDDPAAMANRQFIQAIQLVHKANTSYDAAEEQRQLTEADRLLEDIINRFPDTDLAVQLITNQFVGDFDFFEFRNRVRGLVCNDPLSSRCFLFRIGGLLPPVETPITAARWDWLALAVAYHHLGDPGRAREVIAPFLSAVRRGLPRDAAERDLYVARALALTEQSSLAVDITRRLPDCGTRLYNFADIAEAAAWRNDKEMTQAMAEEARTTAAGRACGTDMAPVVRALLVAGRNNDARTLLLSLVDRPAGRSAEPRTDCCVPELAVAAAELTEVNRAISLLRSVQDENPWVVAAVLGRLVKRGEGGQALGYLEQVKDPDVRAECFAEMIDAFLRRNDRAPAEDLLRRLIRLSAEESARHPGVLALRARGEHALYKDARWRSTFQQALHAAEHASTLVRRDIGTPLVSALMRIEVGLTLLD